MYLERKIGDVAYLSVDRVYQRGIDPCPTDRDIIIIKIINHLSPMVHGI